MAKTAMVQTILHIGINSQKCHFDLVTLTQWQLMIVRMQVKSVVKPWLAQECQ
jgi:hypothetical protein